MRIFLDTVGCRLNQAEIETLARQFRAAGHEIVATAEHADLAVVNTCSVTAAAASDSRAAIRRAGRDGVTEVVVTGCWATLEPEKAGELVREGRVISNLQKNNLVGELLSLPLETFDLEPLARQPLPGIHGRTRAFIKVQDGCDNACTFCITRVARGPSRSRRVEEILADIQIAENGGTKEIVLTGVQLGAWGGDLPDTNGLGGLLSTILEKTSAPRVRLSSLEPWDLEPDFFSLWQDKRLCRHLHLPLQSGSESVLKRMRRKTTPRVFAEVVREARAAIPDVAITTDVIAGFPGESEIEFTESLEFIREMKFAGGHVFTYSARSGTPAARMKDQVRYAVRKERSAILREVFESASREYQYGFTGSVLPVLWESCNQESGGEWRQEGLTDNYLRVRAVAGCNRWNQIDPVRLTGSSSDGLVGEVCLKMRS